MANTHYTPDVSEFFIGFEFEFACTGTVDGIKQEDIWIADKVEDGQRIQDVFERQELMEECFRVKYLDKSDIESLGWIFIPDDSKGDGNFRWFDAFIIGINIFDGYKLAYWGFMDLEYKDSKSQIWNYKCLIQLKDSVIFEGTIKNKSELKKLMQQLNINI